LLLHWYDKWLHMQIDLPETNHLNLSSEEWW
jgi:hypothetical protein